MKKFNNHQKKWAKFSDLWNNFTKPGRPSKDDVKNYNYLVSKSLSADIKNPSIVVLGSTPEIRDMLFKYKKAKVFCAEMTKDMYKAMTNLIRNKNRNEKFINVNWVSLSKKIKSDSVDIVIGDYVTGNVGGLENKFFEEINKILKTGGCFITRQQLGGSRIRKIKDLFIELKRLARKVEQEKLTIKEASCYFSNNIILSTWHLNKKNKISLQYIKDDLRKLEEKIANSNNKIWIKMFSIYKNSYGTVEDKYWYDLPKKQIEKKMKNYFLIKDILYSNDYEIAKLSPIYCLKKKKW